MTDTTPARQYRLPDLGELNLNDAFVIKTHTRVDLLSPPTVAHADAALLWFVSKDTDAPLVYEDLLKLPLNSLGDLIEDEPAATDAATAEATTSRPLEEPEAEDEDRPKASPNSPDNSPGSPVTGDAPPQT